LAGALENKAVALAPVVLTELLSDPLLPPEVSSSLLALPLLEPLPGFWERVGRTRADLIRRKCRPKLADTLIAQTCIDHKAPLLTRDTDFGNFARYAGLALVP
jgi:predicted nucleic acid-binding protein